MRQGDPISLFWQRLWEGVYLSYLTSIQNSDIPFLMWSSFHIFFSDDTIVFLCNGRKSSVTKVVEALRRYELFSGQKVNIDKICFILIPENLNKAFFIESRTCINMRDLLMTYLGVPLYKSRMSTSLFSRLVDKVKRICCGLAASYPWQVGWYCKTMFLIACQFTCSLL